MQPLAALGFGGGGWGGRREKREEPRRVSVERRDRVEEDSTWVRDGWRTGRAGWGGGGESAAAAAAAVGVEEAEAVGLAEAGMEEVVSVSVSTFTAASPAVMVCEVIDSAEVVTPSSRFTTVVV